MPIISGSNPNYPTIKTFSYEMLITPQGTEVCEECLIKAGEDPEGEQFRPIFTDTEMDRNPVCDVCGKVSFNFTPTDECVANWLEVLHGYTLTDGTLTGDTSFLDQVAMNLSWVAPTDEEADILAEYLVLRDAEQKESSRE